MNVLPAEPEAADTHRQFGLDLAGESGRPVPPPLREPPEQAVFLCENKLIALDSILPVAMELRAENAWLDIEFLFLRKDYMEPVRNNYVLWKGMQRTGRISFLAHGGYRPVTTGRKIRSAWRLARKVARFARRRTLLFYRRDFSSFPVLPLALAVHRGGGALIGYPRIAFPMSVNLARSLLNQETGSAHHRYQGDRQLLFHPLQAQEQRRYTSAPLAVIGSPKSFPRWQAFLDEILAEQGIQDRKGNRVELDGRRHVVIFYPGNHDLPDLAGPTSCRDQFLATLRAIREFAPGVGVLIKPHVICDLEELDRDLAAFPDLDIAITFAHPQILARVSDVCFLSNGSSVFDDMYVARLPVIETSQYKPEVVSGCGSLFPNRGRIAAPTTDLIADAVRRVAEAPQSLPEPEIGHLYHPKAESVSACLWPTDGRHGKEKRT